MLNRKIRGLPQCETPIDFRSHMPRKQIMKNIDTYLCSEKLVSHTFLVTNSAWNQVGKQNYSKVTIMLRIHLHIFAKARRPVSYFNHSCANRPSWSKSDWKTFPILYCVNRLSTKTKIHSADRIDFWQWPVFLMHSKRLKIKTPFIKQDCLDQSPTCVFYNSDWWSNIC